MFDPIGFLREEAPKVGDAGHGNGQKFLYNNQGLLLCSDNIWQKLSLLNKSNIMHTVHADKQ
jgi:hypothetical protein